MSSATLCIDNAHKRQIAARRGIVAKELLIFVVEDDTKTRQFICTILRYATEALLLEASDPQVALTKARALCRPIDILISAANTGVDLAREIAVYNPSMKVLLISGRDSPPCGIPAAWRFLAKPFPIKTFLSYVDELCRCVRPNESAA